ncbi:FAD-dependent monooxygenase [Bacillus sp. REN3]|uniref:FAD-dependent monooxygenase n=1 Tax=Bacillus sp. REN3 TaxID=2802440 RepID=UPI001AEF09BD|nr:FAD-dependent monooxygenase [Bacillus sp. REN3]
MKGAKISIIGGGISGLSTAIALQKNGFKAIVYEKDAAYTGPDSGIVLSGNAIRSFMAMGIGEALLSLGVATDTCTLKTETGKVIASFDYHSPSNIPNYLFIQRSVLHRVLTDALHPDSLHYGKQLSDFSQEGSKKVKLMFEDGTSEETDCLIGCDGGHSLIRKKLIPGSKLTYSGFSCWRGMVENTELKNIPFTETWGPKGRFGIAPLPGNSLYWYVFKKAPQQQKDMKDWTSLDLLFNFFSYHDPIQQILEETLDENVVHDELYVLEPLGHFHFGNVLLMGDSAHASMPNIGQGASQAIEDAISLAKWVSKCKTIEQAFSQYNSHRQARMDMVANEMKIYGRAALVDFPILCSLRNIFLQFAPATFHNEKLKKVVEFDDL